MINVETECLAQELAGKKLSSKAHRYIAGELKRMGTTTVNVVVDKTVADALNAVVKETNIVRDAFINRLLWLLRGGKKLLDYLELPSRLTASAFEHYVPDFMPTAPLQAMLQIRDDPLYYLRLASEERHGTGLYLLELPYQLHGFACWLDDIFVPGTATYIDADQLLADLATMEADAFNGFTPIAASTNGVQS